MKTIKADTTAEGPLEKSNIKAKNIATGGITAPIITAVKKT